MAYAHDVNALRQLLRGATRRISSQRRNDRVPGGEDFNRRIGDASAGACVLDDRNEFAPVRRPDKFDQREQCAGDRDNAGHCTHDCLNT